MRVQPLSEPGHVYRRRGGVQVQLPAALHRWLWAGPTGWGRGREKGRGRWRSPRGAEGCAVAVLAGCGVPCSPGIPGGSALLRAFGREHWASPCRRHCQMSTERTECPGGSQYEWVPGVISGKACSGGERAGLSAAEPGAGPALGPPAASALAGTPGAGSGPRGSCAAGPLCGGDKQHSVPSEQRRETSPWAVRPLLLS